VRHTEKTHGDNEQKIRTEKVPEKSRKTFAVVEVCVEEEGRRWDVADGYY
jgi:hypothetical protein